MNGGTSRDTIPHSSFNITLHTHNDTVRTLKHLQALDPLNLSVGIKQTTAIQKQTLQKKCDGCNINLNPDSKKTGVPHRCSGNTFSSRSEITGGLSSNLPSALHRHKSNKNTEKDIA